MAAVQPALAPADTGAAARAVVLDAAGAPAREVPLAAALSEAARGGIVVVRRALQTLGVFDEMHAATLDAIAHVVSVDAAARVRAAGFEGLHRHLSGRELFDVLDAVTARFTPRTGALIAALARGLLGHRGRIYVGGKFWVRFFVPHDVYDRHRALFATRPGHLEILGPHRDSWFTTPTNAVTLWMAMGRVRRGNSMLVYGQLWGRPIARDTPTVPAPQRFGLPVVPELDPGDLLIFSGEHLHASELNVTDETRYVLTVRFTPSAPRYGEGLRWRPYADLGLLESRLAPLATWRSRLTAAWVRQKVRRVRELVRRRVPFVWRLGV
jgi:hypothetical protein